MTYFSKYQGGKLRIPSFRKSTLSEHVLQAVFLKSHNFTYLLYIKPSKSRAQETAEKRLENTSINSSWKVCKYSSNLINNFVDKPRAFKHRSDQKSFVKSLSLTYLTKYSTKMKFSFYVLDTTQSLRNLSKSFCWLWRFFVENGIGS